MTNGSSEIWEAFDAIVPAWQFAACESDIPCLSRPDRFVERGVSLGAVVIKQGDHLYMFAARETLGPIASSRFSMPDVFKKSPPKPQGAKSCREREAGTKLGPAENRSASLPKNAKDKALAQRV